MNKQSLCCVCALAAVALSGPQCGSSANPAGNEATDADTDATGAGSASGAAGSSSGSAGGSSGSVSSSGVGSSSGIGGTSSGAGSPEAGATSGGSGSGGGASSGSSGAGTGGAQSVLQRGNDVFRRGTFTEPGLTVANAPMMKPQATFNGNAVFPLIGGVMGSTQNQGTASALYLEDGPSQAGCPTGAPGCKATGRAANAGLFFAFPAVGSNPNVVAFDETTGLPVWTAHLATGRDGIRGTPVIDAASRRLFVVTGGNPHLVHAISVDNGAEIAAGGWPVTLSNSTLKAGNNTSTFNSSDENQHGALLLVGNILYVPFGGQYGDGGNYLGWIVAVDITNPSRVAGWATQSSRSGIWGSGGLASDGTYVFGVTGDTTVQPNQPRDSSDSEEVVRVSGLAQFTRNEASVFVPTEWSKWDKPTADLDFGASTPAYVPLPAGSKPPGLLVAPAKAGRVFVLDGADLSAGSYPNPGGSLADLVVASTIDESVYTAPTIYTSASGIHAAINVGVGPANCPAGTKNSNEMIVSILLQPGQTPIAKEVWCAPNSGGGHMNYPPISTTTDGVSANAIVWAANGSQLMAVDGDTGAALLMPNGAACNNIPSMSFPIAVKNRIVVAALDGLCSWSVDGQ